MAKKKKKNAKKLVLGVLVAYVAIMALGYMGVSYYFSSHFLKGTTISGIDCSSKTATQVKKKIQKQLGQYKLRIAELDGKTETIQATQIDLTYVDDNKVDELLKEQEQWKWITAFSSKKTYELAVTTTYVDEDSFNIMYFFGMPNNNAEYIQAYSRTGRKYTGIVIDIIRLMRVRDRSYLKNFVTFHQNKDDLVESVPINRWAKNAIYSTLPGILSGVIMQYYTVLTDTDHLYHAVKVKKLLMDGIIKPYDVISTMIAIYDCTDNEKMSLAYKEIISEEVTKILNGIQNGNFTNEEFLSVAIGRYSHGKLMPMRSLRDTEEQVEIKLR